MEQRAKLLPPECPRMILDRRAELVMHLAKQGDKLHFSTERRATFTRTSARPCVLHANGPSKAALKSMERWWDNPTRKPRW